MKRHLIWSSDFDTRANILGTEIREDWEEQVKELWRKNKTDIAEGLRVEFGALDFDRKVRDFVALGIVPFSIVAHHNLLFAQVRKAFVQGAYYPALTGVCALGERILNHLIIDLRESFQATAQYKTVFRKDSFENWRLAVDVLAAWGVLQQEVDKLFMELETQRNRAIHFNPETATNLRDEALAAIHTVRDIIERQFGGFGIRPWIISGTKGHCFIKRGWDDDPFLKRYYLPQCPLVGYKFAIKFDRHRRPIFFDFQDYGPGTLTDEEFRDKYNNRQISDLAPTDPPQVPIAKWKA